MASLIGNQERLKRLLKKHPELVTWKDISGDSAVHVACLHGRIDCLKLLMATGQCDLGEWRLL